MSSWIYKEEGDDRSIAARRITSPNVAISRTTGSKTASLVENESSSASQNSRHAEATSLDSNVLATHRLDNDVPEPHLRGEGNSRSRALHQEDVHGNGHKLAALTSQANQLGVEQRQHMERAEALHRGIAEGEVACGRMTQEILRIQEALRIRKQHVQEDREAAATELRLRDTKMQEILSLVAQIHDMAKEKTSATSGHV